MALLLGLEGKNIIKKWQGVLEPAVMGGRVLNQISKRLLILRPSAKLPGSVFHGQDGSGQIENKHF